VSQPVDPHELAARRFEARVGQHRARELILMAYSVPRVTVRKLSNWHLEAHAARLERHIARYGKNR